MILKMSSEIRELGLSSAVLIARGVDNTKTSQELIAYRRLFGQRLAAYWKNRSISSNAIIQEYHRVHTVFEVQNEPSAPEKLLLYVRRNQDFTTTSAVVDSYNIVSARTLLSIGAHDLERLELPITLRRLTDSDVFQPLGTEITQILPGEFGYVANSGHVICRLDVLQCEWSKVTKDSKSVVFFLQGNRHIPYSTLLKGSWLLAEIISYFCCAEVELVDFFEAAAGCPAEQSKPQIAIDEFKQMRLETGRIIEASPLKEMSLCSVSLEVAGEKIEALAPLSALRTALTGAMVFYNANLHPLIIAGREFKAYLPTIFSEEGANTAAISSCIPSGRSLY